jgi:NAD(P)H-flavin reductase
MLPEPFQVTARTQETSDTWTLTLEGAQAGLRGFAPGQFTMLSAFGAGEVPISISGDPGEPGRLVHTVRAVGLATQAICEAPTGSVLGVRGPFGDGWPVDEAQGADVVILAGGIGLAPLRPAILAILAGRERHGRVCLLYGGRSPDQLLYASELESWRQRGLEVLLTVDTAGPEWLGHVGVVPRLLGRIEIEPERTVALMCGPEVMMRFAADALARCGLDGGRVYASIERNMQCGIGLCGHCQLGPTLICRDGPVYRWEELEPWLRIREL